MNRRRFIAVSAAALAATGAEAAPLRWQGYAMGADVSLTLYGGTRADLDAARSEIGRMETVFSVYDPASELSRINAQGGGPLSPDSARLLAVCQRVHRATGGLFDPTVQPVIRAALEDRALPWHLVGWDRVRLTASHVHMGPGQEMTLNGIAQGYATDRVGDLLVARGFQKALVAVGEHTAIGGPFRLGIEDPDHGMVGVRVLENHAIATSSPGAMRIGPVTHIVDPKGPAAPQWSTITVEARSAALADGLSTALCHAPRDRIAEIARATGTRVTLIAPDGKRATLGEPPL